MWLISTPDFREEVRRTREVTVADSPYISDRERAFNNLLERDMRIASYVEQQARARRLPVVCVNTETIAGTAERLAPQLEAWRRTLA